MDSVNLMTALIKSEITGEEISEEIRSLLTEGELGEIYRLSKFHDLSHLVGDKLLKLGLINNETELGAKFVKNRSLSLYRRVILDYEQEAIISTLKETGIPFVMIKGAVLKNLYPETWMRMSCDIDFFVKKEDVSKASKILCEKLGYTVAETFPCDLQMWNAQKTVHVEMHFSLLENNYFNKAKKVLDSVWDYVISKDGELFLSDDMTYFYLIVHMAKHFRHAGCGIKPFIDLYLYRKQNTISDKCRKMLIEGGLDKFEREAVKLSEHWFNGGEKSEGLVVFERAVIFGGVYGSQENSVQKSIVNKGSKKRYYRSRIFPSVEDLHYSYPILLKCKILLPFIWIFRWFKFLFSAKIRKNVKKEVTKVKNFTDKEDYSYKKMYDYLGI